MDIRAVRHAFTLEALDFFVNFLGVQSHLDGDSVFGFSTAIFASGPAAAVIFFTLSAKVFLSIAYPIASGAISEVQQSTHASFESVSPLK